jgi:hypothetical protein
MLMRSNSFVQSVAGATAGGANHARRLKSKQALDVSAMDIRMGSSISCFSPTLDGVDTWSFV